MPDSNAIAAHLSMPQHPEKIRALVDEVLLDRIPVLWQSGHFDGHPLHALTAWLQAALPDDPTRRLIIEQLEGVLTEAIRTAAKQKIEDPRVATALRITAILGDHNLVRLATSLIPQAANLTGSGALEALIRTLRLNYGEPARVLSVLLRLIPANAGSAKLAFQLLRLAAETKDSFIYLSTWRRARAWCVTEDEKQGLRVLFERLAKNFVQAWHATEPERFASWLVESKTKLSSHKFYGGRDCIGYSDKVPQIQIYQQGSHLVQQTGMTISGWWAAQKSADVHDKIISMSLESPFSSGDFYYYDNDNVRSLVYSHLLSSAVSAGMTKSSMNRFPDVSSEGGFDWPMQSFRSQTDDVMGALVYLGRKASSFA